MVADRASGRAANSWAERHVAVLGGAGFIGSHVTELLARLGAKTRAIGRQAAPEALRSRDAVEFRQADCREMAEVRSAIRGTSVVIHLAGTVGGIQLNRARPAWMFSNNLSTVLPVLDACVAEDIERVLYVSSACVYARDVTIPTPEGEGFVADPEETNLGYGWAKRVGEVASRLYAREYGLHIGVVRPYNAYGPRDDFSPATSHVIPALIRRIEDEPGDELIVWGTGRQTRSFIYVEDLAEGILAAAAAANVADPVNLGSDEEVSIGELAQLLVDLAGSHKRVVFDTSKPDGQLRRQPDLRRAREALGFAARTSLRDGAGATIEYFRSTREPRRLASLS